MRTHYGEDTFPRTACGKRLSTAQLYSTRHDEVDCPRCKQVVVKFPHTYPDHPHGFDTAGKDPIKLATKRPKQVLRKGFFT